MWSPEESAVAPKPSKNFKRLKREFVSPTLSLSPLKELKSSQDFGVYWLLAQKLFNLLIYAHRAVTLSLKNKRIIQPKRAIPHVWASARRKKKKVLKLKILSVHGNVRHRICKCIFLRYSELETAVLKVLNYRCVRNEPIHFKWRNFISKHTVFEVKLQLIILIPEELQLKRELEN